MKKLIIGALLATAGAAHADNSNRTFSGFATVTAGKAYSGYDGEFMGNQCPCFIGNYEHGAVYANKEEHGPEAAVGLGEGIEHLRLHAQFEDGHADLRHAVLMR